MTVWAIFRHEVTTRGDDVTRAEKLVRICADKASMDQEIRDIYSAALEFYREEVERGSIGIDMRTVDEDYFIAIVHGPCWETDIFFYALEYEVV